MQLAHWLNYLDWLYWQALPEEALSTSTGYRDGQLSRLKDNFLVLQRHEPFQGNCVNLSP